jgi:hypothetical protein
MSQKKKVLKITENGLRKRISAGVKTTFAERNGDG